MPIVRTTPTCAPGDECNALLELVAVKKKQAAKDELAKITQICFDSGRESLEDAPQPVVEAPKAAVAKSGNVPEYRTSYEAISEDGPLNAIERFILNDMPNPELEGVNPEGWKARLHEALKFAAKG